MQEVFQRSVKRNAKYKGKVSMFPVDALTSTRVALPFFIYWQLIAFVDSRRLILRCRAARKQRRGRVHV